MSTPIQIDPNPGDRFGATTLEASQQNARYAMEQQAGTVNRNRIEDYLVQWERYVAVRDARPDATNLTVPVPARAEVVLVDTRGWPYIEASPDEFVCPPRTYVPPTKTAAVGLGSDARAITGDLSGLAGALANAKLYGDPILFGGMKFLRIA